MVALYAIPQNSGWCPQVCLAGPAEIGEVMDHHIRLRRRAAADLSVREIALFLSDRELYIDRRCDFESWYARFFRSCTTIRNRWRVPVFSPVGDQNVLSASGTTITNTEHKSLHFSILQKKSEDPILLRRVLFRRPFFRRTVHKRSLQK